MSKSASVASCNSAAWCEATDDVSAALEAGSQRNETPRDRSVSAIVGRRVVSAASSTRRVSRALQAAG